MLIIGKNVMTQHFVPLGKKVSKRNITLWTNKRM